VRTNVPALQKALEHATPQPPWENVLEVIDHADDTGIDLHGANALLAKYAVNALPALLEVVIAAREFVDAGMPPWGDDPDNERLMESLAKFDFVTHGRRDLSPLSELVERVRENYTPVCKCEWDDYGASSRMTTNPDCVIHSEASDPLEELIARAE